MRVGDVRQFCELQDEGLQLMRAAVSQLNLSARSYHGILNLARTTADLAGCEEIQSVPLAEALHASQPAEIGVGVNDQIVKDSLLTDVKKSAKIW